MLVKSTSCASGQTGLVDHVVLQIQKNFFFFSAFSVYHFALFLYLQFYCLFMFGSLVLALKPRQNPTTTKSGSDETKTSSGIQIQWVSEIRTFKHRTCPKFRRDFAQPKCPKTRFIVIDKTLCIINNCLLML